MRKVPTRASAWEGMYLLDSKPMRGATLGGGDS